MADQLLEVVDENGAVISTALRSEIHSQGLLHQEVHVFLKTPEGQVIFQKRASHKDWGKWLDATAGGHVEPGQTPEEAALMELREETGLTATPNDIVLLGMIRLNRTDTSKAVRNNVIRSVFGCKIQPSISQLKVEEKAGAGFYEIPMDTLLTLNADTAHQHNIIPSLVEDDYQKIYQRLKEIK